MRSKTNELMEDARSLVAATADVAEERVADARNRLSETLEKGKGWYDLLRDKTVQQALAADKTVRRNPYPSVSIAAGAGALLGFLAAYSFFRGGN